MKPQWIHLLWRAKLSMVGFAIVTLAGCVNQPPTLTPTLSSTLANDSTPTTALIVTPSLAAKITPTSRPTRESRRIVTSTPLPPPKLTPTSLPYPDNPFKIVFLKYGNLWVTEIGGAGERQLTHESNEWPVYEYAVSPSCKEIAYIPYKGPPTADALVKQVDITSGSVITLTGENDPYSEIDIKWLDDQHIAFHLQEAIVPGHEADPNIVSNVITPFNHIVVDLATGQRSYIKQSTDLSASPDGHYWLTCFKDNPFAEDSCQYSLLDTKTKQHSPIMEASNWRWFSGWSPDSQQLMFSVASEETHEFDVDQLRIVNALTHKEQIITPDNASDRFGAWSPDGQMMVIVRCEKNTNFTRGCGLWLINEGKSIQQVAIEIPGGMDRIHWSTTGTGGIDNIAWTPDGTRIVFTLPNEQTNRYDLWSVRIDGSDLRQIIPSIGFKSTVLCNP